MSRFLVAILCLAGWATAVFESASRRPPRGLPVQGEPRHDVPSAKAEPTTNRISMGATAPSVHSATAVELSDGTIRAFWFGGSREGAKDVAIWSADLAAGQWSPPRLVVDRRIMGRWMRRYIRKLGNPLAHAGSDGRVTLFVVSVSVGGWSGSAVNRLVFSPDGRTLESANRLVASPILNLGTLVRGAAVETGGGELLVPAYHETVKRFPQLLRVDHNGRVLGRGGPAVRGNLLQPWLLTSNDGAMDLFLRRGAGKEAKIFLSRGDGSGWSVPAPIDVPNPDSGLSALRLADGDFLLAANPDPVSRSNLVLLRAPGPEGPWEQILAIDTEEREEDEQDFKFLEYSYPWLMADRAGVVHLLYTWNRREIRHWSIGQDRLPKGGAR